MLVVRCLDASNTNALREGEVYYAFPINEGMEAAYISRFPKVEAHTGCFQLRRFEEVPQVSPVLDAYEVHFYAAATDKKYLLYGFEAADIYMILYKDKQLTQFFACMDRKKCEIKDKIAQVNTFAEYTLFPTALKIEQLEELSEVGHVEEKAEYEQMTLF